MRLALRATVILAGTLTAQVQWQPHLDLAARNNHAMAFDSVRQRVVVFGGGLSRNDLWEWNGAQWALRSSFAGPAGRTGHAMAFDPARGRLVVFGGMSYANGTYTELDDTWEWDGTAWQQANPALAPSVRSGARMAYDAARGRIVLFGGVHIANYQGTFYDDLWEWDGSTWTLRTPTARPPARSEAGLAFDAARARLVLYGGWGGGSVGLVDAWEWDGSAWTQHAPLVVPRLDRGAAATFDPATGRTLVLGQTTPFLQFPRMETWAFDGSSWALIGSGPTNADPFVVIAQDPVRGRTVQFASETWEFDGATWTNVLPGQAPVFQALPSLVFDAARGVPVMVGHAGSGYQVETWERNGTVWNRRLGVGGPSITIGQAMAFDTARGRTVLFGGQSPYGNDQTWDYDGTTWTQLTPSPRPPPLYGHAMAFDPLRQRIVLFGATSTNAPGVTWEWDGAAWTQHTPAHTPWGRRFAGMAWHPGRQRVLLYGGGEGSSTSSLFPDFWEWDGTDWTMLAASIPPGERARHGMVYDSVRERLVVHGGRDTRSARTDTWEWDGVSWTQRAPATNPGATNDLVMAFDPTRNETLLFGGLAYLTWTYAPEVTATTRAFGSGCVGSAGVPGLAPEGNSRPWIGDGFRQVASNLPAGSLAVFKLGVSDQWWGPLPLPFDLSIIGMTGCTEYVSNDVLVGVSTGTGTASYTFPLPNNPSLRGARFFTQVFTVDPTANAFGATTTNAIEAQLGGR